jgi:elongation factor 1 alpha-like protein
VPEKMILRTNLNVIASAPASKITKGGATKTGSEKKADQLANSVETMKIDDTPRATSKNLDVLAEFKKAKTKNAANFVVIGIHPPPLRIEPANY